MFIPIDEAVAVLKRGGVVALPTETVYGLAADATNADAVKKIFAAKNRPADNPLICHFHSMEQIEHYVETIPKYVQVLIHEFCPGPLSFLLLLKKDSPLLTATLGQPSVVCRIPRHWLMLSVIKQLNVPLAAPSANTSGKVSPTTAQMVEDDLGRKIEGIVDGGECAVGVESTIIDCRQQNQISILRPGVIGKIELVSALKKNNIEISIVESSGESEVIPGNKYPHYSPVTPVKRIHSVDEIMNTDIVVLISSDEKLNELKNFPGKKISLGSIQDTEHAAQKLYHNLQSIDELKVAAAYYLETDWGETSAGKAIANRLKKVTAA
jgi:L-threonylcarbamoyladenylate synthase